MSLAVTSNVGRDILQSAALFKHEHQVVWEYVSNGLQYVENESPLVRVAINQSNRSIMIVDNGRGMSFEDLHQFFQMHGENTDRASGRPGRGYFGTGKSAAFGIANKLRVTTVKNNKRSTVELTRSDIQSQNAVDRVPVRVIERDTAVELASGTRIDVEDVNLTKIDRNSIIREIEKHIAHWPSATVYVDHHSCEFIEPLAAREVVISTKGSPFEASLEGVSLILKVAKAPLEKTFQGIAITSKGVLHETTLAGLESKPAARYIFGSMEVPQLAESTSSISPFDMSRSMILNRNNDVVKAVISFIGMNLQRIIEEIESEERKRKESEDAKNLRKEADKIADIINSDFVDWSKQIKKVISDTSGSSDLRDGPTDAGHDEILISGDSILAVLSGEDSGVNNQHSEVPTKRDPEAEKRQGPEFVPQDDGAPIAKPQPSSPNTKRKRGGFSVDFLEMGEENARAKYDDTTRTIFINLDHPQISTAKGKSGIEDPVFRRMAYEVAFSEYAIGLAADLNNTGWYLDPGESIFAIRETLNRLARSAASLYQ